MINTAVIVLLKNESLIELSDWLQTQSEGQANKTNLRLSEESKIIIAKETLKIAKSYPAITSSLKPRINLSATRDVKTESCKYFSYFISISNKKGWIWKKKYWFIIDKSDNSSEQLWECSFKSKR